MQYSYITKFRLNKYFLFTLNDIHKPIKLMQPLLCEPNFMQVVYTLWCEWSIFCRCWIVLMISLPPDQRWKMLPLRLHRQTQLVNDLASCFCLLLQIQWVIDVIFLMWTVLKQCHFAVTYFVWWALSKSFLSVVLYPN